nr:proline-rich receptor-like protein kinase PERK9 [Vicugna pacos]
MAALISNYHIHDGLALCQTLLLYQISNAFTFQSSEPSDCFPGIHRERLEGRTPFLEQANDQVLCCVSHQARLTHSPGFSGEVLAKAGKPVSGAAASRGPPPCAPRSSSCSPRPAARSAGRARHPRATSHQPPASSHQPPGDATEQPAPSTNPANPAAARSAVGQSCLLGEKEHQYPPITKKAGPAALGDAAPARKSGGKCPAQGQVFKGTAEDRGRPGSPDPPQVISGPPAPALITSHTPRHTSDPVSRAWVPRFTSSPSSSPVSSPVRISWAGPDAPRGCRLSNAPQASQSDGAGRRPRNRGLGLGTRSPPTAQAPGPSSAHAFFLPGRSPPTRGNRAGLLAVRLSETMSLFWVLRPVFPPWGRGHGSGDSGDTLPARSGAAAEPAPTAGSGLLRQAGGAATAVRG